VPPFASGDSAVDFRSTRSPAGLLDVVLFVRMRALVVRGGDFKKLPASSSCFASLYIEDAGGVDNLAGLNRLSLSIAIANSSCPKRL